MIPTLLLNASTKRTPLSKLELPAIVCRVPDNVALPDTVTTPLKSPVLADRINLPIELPNRVVFDVVAIAVVLTTNPVVVKLTALIVPV